MKTDHLIHAARSPACECGAKPAQSTSGPAFACGASVRKDRRAGFSLVEMLVSLAIVSVLLTATVVALDASFKAYAVAAESASTHTSARLISHRLLTLVRTSTAHGPLNTGFPTDSDWQAMMDELAAQRAARGETPPDLAEPSSPPGPGADPNVIESPYLRLIDQDGNDVVIVYLHDHRPDANDTPNEDELQIWVCTVPADNPSNVTAQPLIGGVTRARFTTRQRLDRHGVPVLERGSMMIELQPSTDTSLAIEAGNTPPLQVIASTAPRKLVNQ